MFLPFSQLSRAWESKAMGLRRIAGVGPDENLNPWKLASNMKLSVIDAVTVLNKLNECERDCLLRGDPFSWSGGVYSKPLPDGTLICILNPTHKRRRNKVTLMEEIAHCYLGHKPSSLRPVESGLEVREYDKGQELEAYGVGAAALLPWTMFFRLVNSGRTMEQLADHYDVTEKLIAYRIKITGCYRTYQARQGSSPARRIRTFKR